MTTKTYILIDGGKQSLPVVCNGALVRCLFDGRTPYNQRMCGTFQTSDPALQAALEASPMFNKRYALRYTNPDMSSAPKHAISPAVSDNITAGMPAKPLTIVRVDDWAQAKKYLVEEHAVSPRMNNNPSIIENKAASLGIKFVLTADTNDTIKEIENAQLL
jgi:hypothetical protein